MRVTANKALLYAIIRQQVGLSSFSESVAGKVNKILLETEADIRAAIEKHLVNYSGRFTPTIVARLKKIEKTIASIRAKKWSEAFWVVREELLSVSKAEADFLAKSYTTAAPVIVDFVVPSAERLFSEELYVATLDSRTTPICRSLDGKKFPIGVGPKPPLHFSCRSVRVALLGNEAIGTRPAKPFNQKQFLKEYNNLNNIKAKTRADLPLGHKGKFDAYSRQRIRELTQIVDARVTYDEFLSKQTNAFQDSVLGPNRAKLYRKGGLKLDQMVRPTGKQITLAELADMHRSAFIAAGLNPDAF
jgi:hypothetical protein